MTIDKNLIATEVSKTRDFFREGYNVVHFFPEREENNIIVKVWWFETIPSYSEDESVLLYSTRRLSTYDVLKELERRGYNIS